MRRLVFSAICSGVSMGCFSVCGFSLLARRSASVAQEAQQEEEDVDEVKVEGQRSHHGSLGAHCLVAFLRAHYEQLLGVMRRQQREENHPAEGKDEIKGTALHQEAVGEKTDNKPDEKHHQRAPHEREVALRHRPVQRHHPEGARRASKRRPKRLLRVEAEQRSEP